MKIKYIILFFVFECYLSLFSLDAQNQLATDSIVHVQHQWLLKPTSSTLSIDTITIYSTPNDLRISDLRTNEWITLYEYGEQLIDCECNFKNLFRNWTLQFISKVKDIELLSYHYVETIQDSDRINYYYNILTDLDALTGIGGEDFRTSGNEKTQTEERTRFLQAYSRKERYSNSPVFDSTPENEKAEYWEKVKQYIKTELEVFKVSIRLGDRIYVIKSKVAGKLYNNYVVCDPERKRIIWDNIFNVNFSKSSFKLYD